MYCVNILITAGRNYSITYLAQLTEKYTGNEVTSLAPDTNPAWANPENIPTVLAEKAKELDFIITTRQWKNLTNLQRFALLKLCTPGHEDKNFPKAISEFGLVNK